MHLVGQLSNPSARLVVVLAWAPKPGTPKPRPAIQPKRLGNSAVQDAIARVLSGSDRPLRRSEIRRGVAELIGRPVSESSIDWSLSSGSRKTPARFERVGYGRYRLGPCL